MEFFVAEALSLARPATLAMVLIPLESVGIKDADVPLPFVLITAPESSSAVTATRILRKTRSTSASRCMVSSRTATLQRTTRRTSPHEIAIALAGRDEKKGSYVPISLPGCVELDEDFF